jgi:hypothetical protein
MGFNSGFKGLIYTEPVLANSWVHSTFFRFPQEQRKPIAAANLWLRLMIWESAHFVCRIKELNENDQILRNPVLLRGADLFWTTGQWQLVEQAAGSLAQSSSINHLPIATVWYAEQLG